MNYFFLNIVLAFVWALLIGKFTLLNLTVGFILGYLILYFTRFASEPTAYVYKGGKMLDFIRFFSWELIKSNAYLAYDVITPTFHMKPRIIAVPLDVKTDLQITLLANLISLTPGTLSLDVSTDKKFLYIHAMYASDAEETKQKIKDGMERRVLELFSTSRDEG
jgi:multicomponent Na+:H+ antiporter subunit E